MNDRHRLVPLLLLLVAAQFAASAWLLLRDASGGTLP